MLLGLASIAVLSAGQAKSQQPSPFPPTEPVAVLGAPIAIPESTPPSLPLPQSEAGDRTLPINLPTALQLAGVRPLDVAVASERIRVAAAQLERARVLWLPTIYLGTDYFRHDGQLQDVAGNVFGTSKSSFMVGAGPSAVFAVCDAIFAPLAARQTLQARHAALQTAANDSLLSVAEAYFNVQQARGALAGAEDAARRAADVLGKTKSLVSGGLVTPAEVSRARTELSSRRQDVQTARERWRLASADLTHVLQLDSAALVQPLEPPHLLLTLVSLETSVDELIPLALLNRPELEGERALIQASLERLRQEQLRPLIPSLFLRGASTPVVGTLAGGYFGGGTNNTLSNFGARGDFDIQVLWTFENLGFGNLARVKERKAENQLAVLHQFSVQDQVKKEVVQAHAQVRSAAARLTEAEEEVKDAVLSADQNLAGLVETKGPAKQLAVLIRPQEVVQSVQALSKAYADYYSAVADYDRAQFRLYRALGRPAQGLTCQPVVAPSVPIPASEPIRPPG